jgi:hypothetical protein
VIRQSAHDTGASRLSRRDLLRVASLGLRSRRVRAALSALGISIGIAAIVGVLGISQSSKTGLLNELGQLGNILTVQPQAGIGQATELPATAEGMVSRIGPVTSVTEIGAIANVYVYRSPLVPASDTSGISLTAADGGLPATLGTSLAHGTFLNAATARYPAVVLGAETASLLGIGNLARPTQLWIGGHWFTVVGILNPVELLPQLDSMAFIGFPVAEQYFGFDGHPTGLYLRSVPPSPPSCQQPSTRPTPRSSRSATRPTSSKPRWSPKAPTTGSSSASAPWRSSSGASASPTSWSSPSSNAAPRSACAAHWAPPAATSPSSSWPRHCSCQLSAGWPAPSLARWRPSSTR